MSIPRHAPKSGGNRVPSSALNNQNLPSRYNNSTANHSSGSPRPGSDADAASCAPQRAFFTPMNDAGPRASVNKEPDLTPRDESRSSDQINTTDAACQDHRSVPHRVASTASEDPGVGDTSEVESYSTVYHKLTRLCADIETAIYTAKCTVATLAASDTRKALARIRMESFTQKSPEAEYATRLFQYYSTQCNNPLGRKEVKPSSPPASSSSSLGSDGTAPPTDASDGLSICAFIPPALYSGLSGQIHGVERTLHSNLFWMRGAVFLLGMVSFICMAYVPTIGQRDVSPVDMVKDSCVDAVGQGYGFRSSGAFSMVSLAYVLALGVILATHSAVCMAYYMLPLDDQGRKCIPGITDWVWLQRFASKEDLEMQAGRIGGIFSEYSARVHALIDVSLLVALFIACTIASASIDTPVQFTPTTTTTTTVSSTNATTSTIDAYVALTSASMAEVPVFASLRTFLATYSSEDCDCILPALIALLPTIRCALAFAFLTAAAQCMATQVSIRTCIAEQRTTRRSASGGNIAYHSPTITTTPTPTTPTTTTSSSRCSSSGTEEASFDRDSVLSTSCAISKSASDTPSHIPYQSSPRLSYDPYKHLQQQQPQRLQSTSPSVYPRAAEVYLSDSSTPTSTSSSTTGGRHTSNKVHGGGASLASLVARCTHRHAHEAGSSSASSASHGSFQDEETGRHKPQLDAVHPTASPPIGCGSHARTATNSSASTLLAVSSGPYSAIAAGSSTYTRGTGGVHV